MIGIPSGVWAITNAPHRRHAPGPPEFLSFRPPLQCLRTTRSDPMRMTEADWLTSDNPQPMLQGVFRKAGDRKVRLFACACARMVWEHLGRKHGQAAVEASERFADGLATAEQCK